MTPNHGERRTVYLTLVEQKLLISKAGSYMERMLFRLALTTGIRREDLVAVEVGGIDLEEKSLRFWEAKKSRHWAIPLFGSIVEELPAYLQSLPQGARYLFPETGKSTSGHMSGKTAWNRLQAAIQRAGIKKKERGKPTNVRFHDLRRSLCQTAEAQGISMKVLVQITGDREATLREFYQVAPMDEMTAMLKDK
jgi:integrase